MNCTLTNSSNYEQTYATHRPYRSVSRPSFLGDGAIGERAFAGAICRNLHSCVVSGLHLGKCHNGRPRICRPGISRYGFSRNRPRICPRLYRYHQRRIVQQNRNFDQRTRYVGLSVLGNHDRVDRLRSRFSYSSSRRIGTRPPRGGPSRSDGSCHLPQISGYCSEPRVHCGVEQNQAVRFKRHG